MTDRHRRRPARGYTPTHEAVTDAAAAAPVLLRATARSDRSGEVLALVALNAEARTALNLLLSQLVVTRLQKDAHTTGLPVETQLQDLLNPSLPTIGNGLMPSTVPGPDVTLDLIACIRATLAEDGEGASQLLTALAPTEVGSMLTLAIALLAAMVRERAGGLGVEAAALFDEKIAPYLRGAA